MYAEHVTMLITANSCSIEIRRFYHKNVAKKIEMKGLWATDAGKTSALFGL